MHARDRVFAMTNFAAFACFYSKKFSWFSNFFLSFRLICSEAVDCAYLESFHHLSVQLLISWGRFLLEQMACDIPQTGNPIHTSLSRCSLTKSSSWSCFISQNGSDDKRRARGGFYSLATGKAKPKAYLGFISPCDCCPWAQSQGTAGVTPGNNSASAGTENPNSWQQRGWFWGVHSTGKGSEIQKLSGVSAGVLTAFPAHWTSEHSPSCSELQCRKTTAGILPCEWQKAIAAGCLGLELGSCTSFLKLPT